MSYILDALRKADADRERGNVPNLHAQPILPGAARPGAARARRSWIGFALGALAMLLIAALAWWWFGDSGSHAPAASANPAALAGATPASTSAPAPAAAAQSTARPNSDTTVAQAAPPNPAPTASAPHVPATPPPRAKPKPAPTAKATPANAKADAESAGTEAAAPPQRSADAGASAPGVQAHRVYTVSELPEEIRRQLPAVTIGGSMYSPTAANRILIVNGQVLHEGENIAPELALQQIRIKAAVLAFKGYRYLISF